ncbi:MAG: hypothetical protein IPK91_08995 [Saprospiraceae bacterium]|jgi:hypothetical protein|nr:hypothetical protein [Saprospiraceae bacterium]MBK8297395.1 hypothetical protein [Saprospiraceae bacterium]
MKQVQSNFNINGIFRCFSMLFLFSSCIDESPKLNRIIEFKADSLLQLEINNLSREADSFCRIFHQLNHPIFLDSIVALRKKEILQLQQGL